MTTPRPQLEQRRVELPNTEEIARYVADFRDFLQEGTIPERKALIRNFVEGIEVEGDEATLTYTVPMPSDGAMSESASVLDFVKSGSPRKTRTCCYSGREVCTGLEACAKLAGCQFRRYRTGFTNKRPGLNSEPPSWRLTFPAAPHVNPDVPAPVLPGPGARPRTSYIWSLSYTLTNKMFTASHFGRRRPLDFIQKGGRQGEPGLPVFSKGRTLLQVSGQPGVLYPPPVGQGSPTARQGPRPSPSTARRRGQDPKAAGERAHEHARGRIAPRRHRNQGRK